MKDKKRVVFCLPSASVGGIEHHLARQLRFFSLDEYEISIVLLFAKGALNMQEIVPEGVLVYELHFKNLYDVASIRKLWRLFNGIKPDVVVSSAFDANALIRILQPFFGYVAVPRLHNLYLNQTVLRRWVDWVLSFMVPTIVCVSRDVALHAAKQTGIPLKKFTVITNGIDLDEIADANREDFDELAFRSALGIGRSERVILSVSRLKAQKNLGLALEAFSLFKKQDGRSSYRLVIVGGGEELATLKQKAQSLGVSGDVIFAGTRRDAFRFYRIADMFLMTSIREGFPNVLLESMAFGVPFVSTRVPGVVDVIKDGVNGYLADSTPEDLAFKMGQVVERGAHTMKDACYKTAQKHSMRENARAYQRLFDRITSA